MQGTEKRNFSVPCMVIFSLSIIIETKKLSRRAPGMLISVHLSKTAGSSFMHSLENYYGKHLRKDYETRPLEKPAALRYSIATKNCLINYFRAFKGIECIHGHFLPLNYLLLGSRKDVKFVTWLRNPVERMASHYFYWQRAYHPQKASHPVHRRMMKENWTLEQFCLFPELRNYYHQYLWGFPLSRFDFIGITEYFEEDFLFFSEKFLGLHLPIHKTNTNPEKKSDEGYSIDTNLRQKIEAYHEKDMRLYRQLVENRLRVRYL